MVSGNCEDIEIYSSYCVAVTVICTVLSILLYRKEQKDGFECIPFAHLNLVYAEELLFFAFFLMWTYFAGFHPAAYGTENLWIMVSWKQ